MLIIFEGVHNSGKSTLANLLVSWGSEQSGIEIHPFQSVSRTATKNSTFQKPDRKSDEHAYYAAGATIGTIQSYKALYKNNKVSNLLVDRFHLSCQVYDEFFGRKQFKYSLLEQKIVNDALLILIDADETSIMERCREKERNTTYTKDSVIKLRKLFKQRFIQSKIQRKVLINTSKSSPEECLETIIFAIESFDKANKFFVEE